MSRLWKLAASLLAVALVSSAALAQPPKHPTRPVARATRSAAPTYASMVRTWHTPSSDPGPPTDEAGHPLLVLHALNAPDRVALPAASSLGTFAASDLDRAAWLLRDPATGAQHPVEPRLLDLVFRVQVHFGASEVRVLSGYRLPRHGNGSNHGKGRALDLVIPGANDADVAAYARTLGFVGVGVYPVSGFVHVDVRDRSYFWTDSSGPGKRNRERGILGDLARKADHDAIARGEPPTGACLFQPDVDEALRSCAARARSQDEDDDDDAND